MSKSSTAERNKRINLTISLLKQFSSSHQVVSELIKRYGVSRRQAYRYVEEAQGTNSLLPVPEQKMVFTVKLPWSLVQRLRAFANATGHSLSDLTSQAIERFLRRAEKHG